MDIQDQVCTLEQALRLKCLGVVQESLFYHRPLQGPGNSKLWQVFYKNELPIQGKDLAAECLSAFTLAEIGKALDWEKVTTSPPYKKEREWRMFTNGDDKELHDYNEVVARAEALIYQLEKSHTTPAEVNNRLTPFCILKTTG